MSDTPRVEYFLEETLPPGASASRGSIAGWIFTPSGSRCCAVRARGSGPTVPGLLGIPRPDVLAAFPHEPSAGFSGFRIDLHAANRRPVVLEWMDPGGFWREFWRESPSAAAARPNRNVRSRLPTRLLPLLASMVAGQTRNLPGREAWLQAQRLADDLMGRDTLTPTGVRMQVQLDEPANPISTDRALAVSGWIFSRGAPIKKIFGEVVPGGAVHLIYPRPRPDVIAAHPADSPPLLCGFDGMVLLPSESGVPVELRLYVLDATGTTLLALSRRLHRPCRSGAPTGNVRTAALAAGLALTGICRPHSWRSWWKTFGPRPRGVVVSAPASSSHPVVRAVAIGHAAPFPAGPAFTGDPLISIVVPVFNPPERYLREMIASVRAQSYPRWELCLADDASTATHVRTVLLEAARADARIRPVFRTRNGHIARASNSALALARGEFVALLDHDDLLAPVALQRVVESIRDHPTAHFFYTDRDKIDDRGRHFDAENRGAWNPAMAMTHNYLHHLTVIRHDVVHQAGAFRADFYGSQDLDLYLRCHERLSQGEIVHVPGVAYHWRAHPQSTASRGDQKDYMFDSARRAIADALARRGLRAMPFLPAFGPIYGMNLHQLRWDPGILHDRTVTMVLAARSTPVGHWQACLAALRATVPAVGTQFIVVGHEAPAGQATDVTFLPAPPDPGLAARFNLGAQHAHHSLLCFLDITLKPVTAGWLEDLAGWLSVPGVAAVGPKLVNPDGRLASAGWTIGHHSRLPRPLCAGEPIGDLTPPFLSQSARDAWLLDPRCLLIRADVFAACAGFASDVFPHRLFAADLCLRLRAQGHRVVFSPQATLEIGEPPASGAAGSEDQGFRARHPHSPDPWILPPQTAGQRTDGVITSSRGPWLPESAVAFGGGWFHLEHPTPTEEIHAGHQVFGGWCWPAPDHSISDLRVRGGAQFHLVEYGYPRPDLAAAFGGNGDFGPAGFRLELALPPGPVQLVFEACVAGDGWRPVATVGFTVQRRPALTCPAAPPPVTADHFAADLETLLKQSSGKNPPRLEARAAAFARQTAGFKARRHAASPFHGYIDQPTPHFLPTYGEATILGWLFHETQPILRVTAAFGPGPGLEISHQGNSPNIGRLFPNFNAARRCELLGAVTVPHEQPQPLALHIWAELADGTWHLAFVFRCRAHAHLRTDASRLQGVGTGTLLRAAASLQLAYGRRGIRGPGWPAILKLVAKIRHEWPVPLVSPAPACPSRPSFRFHGPHILFVTHNLNREGAPMFLLELARHCRTHLAARLTVVSPEAGPLGVEFERIGAEVCLVDRRRLWSARTMAETDHALAILGHELRAHEASLVVANTIESFWAVPAAIHAHRPVIFYVHEPGVLGHHYLGTLAPDLRRFAAATLTQATCVSFTNEATRAYYQSFAPAANQRIQPGWTQLPPSIPLSPAGRIRLRTRLGLGTSPRVVINVGTLCPRKGQRFFIQAIEHLGRHDPALAATCRFVLIGTHDNHYGAALLRLVSRLQRPNITFVPATDRVSEYFAVADLFVLSSFEEGFSRVLLEAMGFGLPIVSTGIHGIPEITRPGREALLVPAGDAPAMATAMRRILADPPLASRLGAAGRARLAATYTADRVLPGHLATILELAPDLKPVAGPRLLAASRPGEATRTRRVAGGSTNRASPATTGR